MVRLAASDPIDCVHFSDKPVGKKKMYFIISGASESPMEGNAIEREVAAFGTSNLKNPAHERLFSVLTSRVIGQSIDFNFDAQVNPNKHAITAELPIDYFIGVFAILFGSHFIATFTLDVEYCKFSSNRAAIPFNVVSESIESHLHERGTSQWIKDGNVRLKINRGIYIYPNEYLKRLESMDHHHALRQHIYRAPEEHHLDPPSRTFRYF